MKALRTIAALGLAGLILHVASLATRDCSVGLLAYDNCWWLWVRERCGLPANKFLRAGFLGLVGLGLLAVLIMTFRYVFPSLRRGSSPTMGSPSASRPDSPENQASRRTSPSQ